MIKIKCFDIFDIGLPLFVIRLLCKSNNADLANEFLNWLKLTNQHDLHKRLVGKGDATDAMAAMKLDEVPASDSDSDQSGASDCESLSSKTTAILSTKEKKVAPSYVLDMVGVDFK